VTVLSLPDNLEWAAWKTGAGAPPIWINENQGIFLIHGISIRENKYIYNIGVSLLERRDQVFSIKVYTDPIITGSELRSKVRVRELRPKLREVVYVCGALIDIKRKDLLHLYVNVGDRATLDVVLSLDELKKVLGVKP